MQILWKLLALIILFVAAIAVIGIVTMHALVDTNLRNSSQPLTSQSSVPSKFIMNQLFANSTILTDNILTIEIDVSDDWSVVAKDTTSIAFKNGNTYLAIQSKPGRDDKIIPETSEEYKVDTLNLGSISNIKLKEGEFTSFLYNRFNINGSIWHGYSNNYIEQGCKEREICRALTINIYKDTALVPLSVSCIATVATDIVKCDSLIKTMAITLHIDD